MEFMTAEWDSLLIPVIQMYYLWSQYSVIGKFHMELENF